MPRSRNDFAVNVWPETLALYDCDGIAPICLRLQDRFDVDVALMLVLFLSDHAGIGGSVAEGRALIGQAAAWRDTAIRPLRRVRNALKDQFVKPTEVEFRGAVKALELEAERLHVARLATAIAGMTGQSGPFAPVYLADCGIPSSEVARLLKSLNAARAGLCDQRSSRKRENDEHE